MMECKKGEFIFVSKLLGVTNVSLSKETILIYAVVYNCKFIKMFTFVISVGMIINVSIE